MAEPGTTAAAGALSFGLAGAFLQMLGIDPIALFWGTAGGIAFLLRSEPAGRVRSIATIAGAGLVAAALTGIVSHYVQRWLETPANLAIVIPVGFVLGLSSQTVLDVLLDRVPRLLERMLDRSRGGRDGR